MHPQLDNRLRSKLRLRHFELLDALGDTLNIRKAAPRLHLSQSTATKLLQEIEALYKTLLFERLPSLAAFERFRGVDLVELAQLLHRKSTDAHPHGGCIGSYIFMAICITQISGKGEGHRHGLESFLSLEQGPTSL